MAKQSYTPFATTQSYFPSQIKRVSTKIDKEFAEDSKLAAKPATYKSIILADNPQTEFLKFTSEHNDRYDTNYLVVNEESKSSVYYNSPVKAKSLLSRFFIGDHFSARMDTFQNSEIPFLARGSGVATEISTQSTNLSASYFKANSQNTRQNNMHAFYQKERQPLSTDTKLALAIPFFPQFKLFGGYSYNRSIDARLSKGPSFGFQADVLKHIKIDATFVKQTVGKTTAKVLFSFNLPFEQIKF